MEVHSIQVSELKINKYKISYGYNLILYVWLAIKEC